MSTKKKHYITVMASASDVMAFPVIMYAYKRLSAIIMQKR